MAIKDWKKIGKSKEFEYEFWHNNKRTKVVVTKFPLNKGWGVFRNKQWLKSFRTKSTALKFAKSYMRKH